MYQINAQTTYIVSNNPAANGGSSTIWFDNFQAAHDAASAGDILMIQPNGTSYGDIDITKALTIIGAGFNLGSNANAPQTNAASSKFGQVVIQEAGAGTVLMGLEITGRCYIRGDGSIVQRNKIKAVAIDDANNVTLGQNWIYSYWYLGFGDDYGGLFITGQSENMYVHNNYIYGSTNGDYSVELASGTTMSGIFKNNVIRRGCYAVNTVFENNIFMDGPYPNTTSNAYYNNILRTADNTHPLTGVNGNIVNAGEIESIFAAVSGNLTTYYTLVANSPALGAGADGTDCGVFGGTEPYIPSGVPPIPVIYFLEAPTNAIGGNMEIQIKARSNN